MTVAGFALFRAVVMGTSGLGDSESYYWAWSKHPALSYYDHPPLTAWIIHLSTAIGGDTSFWVRLPSLLLFIAMSWLLYRLCVELFDDRRIAFLSILTFNLIPMFGIGALQMVPDIPAAVCYLMFIILAWRVLENDGSGWIWLLMGAVLGVGLLGKYFAILLLPSVMLLTAAIPKYRRWYLRPEPYLMGLLALIIFSPVIWWNYSQDWPSFKFHLVNRHAGAPFTADNFGRLFGGQALYVTPLYLIGLLWGAYAGVKAAMKGDNRHALLVAFSIPTLAFFYFVTAWTNESEPHWPAFGYLTAIILMVERGLAAIEAAGAGAKKWMIKYFAAATAMACVVFGLFYIHVYHPILPIKPKYDLVNELYGWDLAGVEITKAYDNLTAEQGGAKPFALAHHWVLCSQMMFATKNKIEVACLNEKTDQFDFWNDETKMIGRSAVMVSDLRFEEPPDELYIFDSVKQVAEVPFIRGGQVTRKFTIWECKGFKGRKHRG
ncbi:MAG: glycosyltransferase family 39 protein [Nitrospinae bacterium]|nr:glycosyltransferase family 39 protein [Nitrospinota bacterium]